MSDTSVRKRALADFYEKFTPPPLPTEERMDGILRKFTSDDDLYSALIQKYNLNSTEVDERRRKIKRLEDFYAKYAAESASKISSLLKKSDNIDELLDALRLKYKVSADEFPNVAGKPVPVSQVPNPPLESMLPKVSEKPPAPIPTAQEPPAMPSTATANTQMKVKEQLLSVREEALRALTAAVEAKSESLSLIPLERAAHWAKPADVTLEINSQFISHLSSIEQKLLRKAFELSTMESSMSDREATIAESELRLREKVRQLEENFSEFIETRNADRASRAAMAARLEEQQRFCEQRLSLLEAKDHAMVAREAEVEDKIKSTSSKAAVLASGEASLSSQQKIAAEERDLAKRLSEEVLKREATVRVVEKALNQARSELTRLEDDLGARTRKLLADESAVRTWAGEVERKESKLQAILEQLKQKGVVVSGL